MRKTSEAIYFGWEKRRSLTVLDAYQETKETLPR